MLNLTPRRAKLTKGFVKGVRCEVAPNIPLQIEDLYQMLGVFVTDFLA